MAGLQQLGFKISTTPRELGRGDVLLIWNRYGAGDRYARAAEAAGAAVIVAENGYLGRQWNGGRWYAMSLNRHNGAGQWFPRGPERWARIGTQIAPWREAGDHVLVLPQRGIGTPPVAQPPDWQRQLRIDTARPVRIRPHPGERGGGVPLEDDLRGAHACITWASGAALKALAAGVPVFHACAQWIGAPAARRWPADPESPLLGDRLPMFERLAWAMWELEEIARGDAFRHLLSMNAVRRQEGAEWQRIRCRFPSVSHGGSGCGCMR